MSELPTPSMTFDEWLELGVALDYCTPQFCQTHDGGPVHPSEEAAWERGEDPCVHIVRLGALGDWDVGEESLG